MKPNRKENWCIIFGEATDKHPSPKNYQKFVGTPVLRGSKHDPNKEPKLFSLRSEAEKYAKELVEKYGHRWEVSVEKYHPRFKPNPYQTS